MKKILRIVCLLLSFVLIFNILCHLPVKAAEALDAGINLQETVADTEDSTQDTTEETAEETTMEPAEETVEETTIAPAEETTEDVMLAPTESTETEISEPTEALLETLPEETLSVDSSSLMSTRATYTNGKYRQRAVIWTTNGEAVTYTYNGKTKNVNQILMHTIWWDGAFRIGYCIDPGQIVYVNSDYEEVEYSGTDAWGKLNYAKQRGVSLALLYGYPNSFDSSDLRTQLAYQLATYMIVHEIILGWRQDVHPFARTNDSYFDVFGGGTESNPEYLEITSEYYSEVHTKYLRTADIQYAYNYISNKLATHDLIPSFANKLQEQAPTYTMKANSNGTYSITLTDTNNILSAYSFTNTSDLTFTKSADGKSVTITTSNSNLSSVVIAPTRTVPSVENSAFLIWNADTGSQEMCTLKTPKYDPVPAYFKLKLPVGGISIHKLPDDSQNYGGWKFSIYADEACTQLVKGPLTTPESGVISVENLPVGNYWVKELGNTDKDIENQYYCLSANPQPVTVSSGSSSLVTFLNNRIRTGHLVAIKSTDSNVDVMGWEFALYSDEACQTLAYGPVATDSYGMALFASINVGTYWLKEIGNTNPELNDYYTCMSRNPQPVTILADDTVNVYFNNKMNAGSIAISKTDPYGNPLPGAHFLLEWSVSGSIWSPVESSTIPGWGKSTTQGIVNGILITDSSGYASFQTLPVGVYYRISEVKAPNGFQLLGDYAYEGMLTSNGEVINLNVVNTPVFTLPHTGSRSMIGMSAGLALCLLTCVGAVIYLKRKEI